MNLQSPFRNVVLTTQMEAYNEAMSSVMFFEDWLFADILNYFKFLDFKKNFKLRYMSQIPFKLYASDGGI